MVNLGAVKREEWLIIGGLIGMQFIYAGNTVIFSYLMTSLQIPPFSLIIFTTLPTFMLLSPLSYICEREQWPKKLSTKLLIQLVYTSFTGITLLQTLFLKGMKMTSTTIATSMPNLAPALIFLLSWAFGYEEVKVKCKYSRVKIGGTLICVFGAIMLSVMQATINSSDSKLMSNFLDKEKFIGSLYLLFAVIILSSNVVLQAHILEELHAPMTLCAMTSLIGLVITVFVEMVQDHRFRVTWPIANSREFIGYSFLLAIVGGVCVSFNGWALKKRGPVFVSMFNPITTVISAILSAVTLGETVTFGSIGGMCVMFTGLYFVLWAKGKEGLQNQTPLPKKV